MNKRVAGALIFILFALGVLSLGTWRVFSKSTLYFKPEVAQFRELFRRPLDGVLVERERESLHRPIAIVIDNGTDAQPFRGVGEARLIFETIAEGNITRLLAIYDPAMLPDTVGPVRSVRPYFVSWAGEVNAVLIHVGGSPDGLTAVDTLDHINEFYDGSFFFRDRTRRPPHNIFTSRELLHVALEEKQFAPTTTFPFWTYADIEHGSALVQRLDINFSIPQYRVRWEYNQAEKKYRRVREGERETLFADSIVVMAVQAKVLDRELRRSLTLEGEGRAWVFTRGGVQVGTWIKKSENERTQFIDANGKPLVLSPGVTWVEVIDDVGKLEF